jgi:uncharacterized protein YqeY
LKNSASPIAAEVEAVIAKIIAETGASGIASMGGDGVSFSTTWRNSRRKTISSTS